jgi:hypothetical protein
MTPTLGNRIICRVIRLPTSTHTRPVAGQPGDGDGVGGEDDGPLQGAARAAVGGTKWVS